MPAPSLFSNPKRPVKPSPGPRVYSCGGGRVNESELDLIQRSLQGDLEAWGEIVRRYKEAVFAMTLAVLRNRADAEDATQEAFIRAYQKLGHYDLSRKFSTWLFTVAINVAKNLARKRRPDPLPKEIVSEDPAYAAWRDEVQVQVREVVWSLPEEYRLPLVLRYWHDLPLEEIGKMLKLPVGTVKTRLFRARALVEAALVERGVIHNALG